jgi:ATP-dependent DNA helicase RecG
MPQKDPSTTTWSASATNKPQGLDTPVQFIKGVGPRLGAIFNSRGIRTVRDLLLFFPRAYEDRSKIASADQVEEGQKASFRLTVVGQRKIPIRSRGKMMLEVRCTDGKNPIVLKYFYIPKGLENRLAVGTQFYASGTVKQFMNRIELVHPELNFDSTPVASKTATEKPVPSDSDALPRATSTSQQSNPQASAHTGRIVPIYTEIDGVPTKTLRKILFEAVQKYAPLLEEDLPEFLVKQLGFPKIATCVREIHFPESSQHTEDIQQVFRSPFHQRLIFEEFFKFEWLVLRARKRREIEASTPLHHGPESVASLIKRLPFELTGDQKKSIQEVLDDLARPHPMNRLIQGDVGSGKTAVALLCAGAIVAEGGQVALMAPTEILAEQHFKNCIRLFADLLPVDLLLGRSTTSQRAKLQAKLSSGQPMLVIGTHALIEDPVEFKNLQLILVDEQHRFGVEQRRKLRQKGVIRDESTQRTLHPHTLILTATPIPRTLALTAYGDLHASSIREMPPGRSPIKTKVIWGDARQQVYDWIREELKRGRQAYFIYPLVNESEAEGFTELKSATQEAERLQKTIFSDFKIGLLHGQLKAQEKAEIMDAFKSGEIHVLVSTTVVEVGVDVPNATVMAIEHAERFGLSQLHQLRGRVGRGKFASSCFLFAPARTGEVTAERLEVLEQTTDGFEIAEADLQIRGPGEFLGTRQAGALPFRMADLVRDQDWLFKARAAAADLLERDPELLDSAHGPLRSYLVREGRLQQDRLKTS